MRTDDRESIKNYIAAVDNTKDNGNEKFKASVKNGVFTVLFLCCLPLVGVIARKEIVIACVCTCILLIVCLLFYIEGRWFILQFKNNNNSSILIHRITACIGTMLSWTISLLYVIILLTGQKEEAVLSLRLVTTVTALSIPFGVFRAFYLIKNKKGIETRRTIKAPPFWFAVTIASFFSRLTHDGIIFSITTLLCIANFYVFYSTLIPNAVRLYFVKKYGLEREIPRIFEI